MTALTRTDIPASVTTVEQLAAWCCSQLAELNFQAEITEAPNVIQKVAISQIFPVNINGAYALRYVGRVSLPVSTDHFGDGKMWEKVQPLSSSPTPTNYKS